MVKILSAIDDRNIISLCKNHHWLYDHNKLSQAEFEVIREDICFPFMTFGSSLYEMLRGCDGKSHLEFGKWWNDMDKKYGLITMEKKLDFTENFLAKEFIKK